MRDRRRRDAAVGLAHDLYALHEAGRDYSSLLPEFSRVVGKSVSVEDVHGAFGSIKAESFAEDLLADRSAIPKDLSESEMLELIERICAADGTESQMSYWLDCLAANTGDERLTDLIFWPGEYFGDGDNSRELTPQEILSTALAGGRPAAG